MTAAIRNITRFLLRFRWRSQLCVYYLLEILLVVIFDFITQKGSELVFIVQKNGNNCQRNDWYCLEVVEAIIQIIGNFSVRFPVSAHWFYDLCKLVGVDFDYPCLIPVRFSSDLVTIALSSLRLGEICPNKAYRNTHKLYVRVLK